MKRLKLVISLGLIFTAAVFAGFDGWCYAQETEPPRTRFPVSENAEVGKLLGIHDPSLPTWAATLAQPLPKTTAAMLQLDTIHRAQNPLGPILAGELRWATADAMDCDYAKRYAEADLRRSGISDESLKQLVDEGRGLPEAERAAIAFARRLSLAASAISDDEIAEMLKQFSPDELVGIVHTVAFGNFQNRILLALAVEVEQGGPLPPLNTPFSMDERSEVQAPERPAWVELQKVSSAAGQIVRPNWDARDFADIEQALARQKKRSSRLPMPDPSRFANLPPEAQSQSKIVWSKVSMGYQPQLTKAWFDCMGTFQQEATLDRVFSNSVFLVITRSSECFY